MPSRFIQSIVARRSSSTLRSMPLRADSAWRRNWITETPGISCGYWNARNMPALARTSGGQSVMSSPWNRIRPAVTSYSGEPSKVLARVLLPGSVGAHDGVRLAGVDRQRQASEDLFAGGSASLAADSDDGRSGVQIVDAEQLAGSCGHGHQCISPIAVVETPKTSDRVFPARGPSRVLRPRRGGVKHSFKRSTPAKSQDTTGIRSWSRRNRPRTGPGGTAAGCGTGPRNRRGGPGASRCDTAPA